MGLDFEEEADAPAPPVTDTRTLQTLQEYCVELESLKAEEENLKQHLKAVQSRIASLRLTDIPDLMHKLNLVDAANRGSITLPSGARVSMRTDFYASINKQHEEQAFEWLRSNGLGEIIRPTVNAATLKATLRERMKDGKDIPETFISTYFETSAVLTRAKS